jgi:glycosyltransferase involved in cell wall biosynthesis
MSVDRPLRIAWLGPGPTEAGGVPGMAGQTLLGLADRGDVELEVFVESRRSVFLDALAARPSVGVTALSTRWQFDRWYSSNSASKLVTGTASRVRVGSRIAQRVAERHAARPFDVLYRFSQIELLALRPLLHRLPPVVLHPEVHAHGELRHHGREWRLALRGESPAFYALNHAYLAYRSAVQRRDLRSVDRLIAPSARFADLVAADYGYPRERIRVIPNVVELDRYRPSAQSPPCPPVRLLFVSRMAVRKGVEQVVELSRRIGDLAGRVQIDCIGGASLFSDYTRLLRGLNPAVARTVGAMPPAELAALYRSAHGLLQPSIYEPFAITVAEALASGLPVIVSDEVGAREGVDPRVCRAHGVGDVAGLEREVRRLVEEVERGWDPELRALARRHAETMFNRDRFASELVDALAELRGGYTPRSRAGRNGAGARSRAREYRASPLA